jgi:DNA-binding NarL/FixJ family response regulator
VSLREVRLSDTSYAVEGAAGLAAAGSRSHSALKLAGFSTQLRKAVAIPRSAAREQLVARRLAPARQSLSEAVAAAAWAEGEALALEQAVATALAELASVKATAGVAVNPQSSPSDNLGGLMARERDVAALIAAGSSNRAIATTLVVGVKTVEAYISRILSKLGFSSRAQIAAWAVAKGLAPAPEDLQSRMGPHYSE